MSLIWILSAVAVLGAAGCGGDDTEPGSACVQGLSADCAPLYTPASYDSIFTRTLHPTCASGMGTCHTADVKMGGLVFEDADASYALLLGETDGKRRVVPGDPGCSLLLERLTSDDPNVHMPPGPTSILPGEQCDIVQWISAGAKR